MIRKALITAALALALAVTVSYAQAPPTPATPQPPPQSTVRCAPTQVPRAGEGPVVAPPTTGQSPGATLSDKLAQSDGVLCPPPVDSDIQKRPPDVGNTPVIPPPGTPGGDPSVRPK